jgi:pimeloyl-ACP methyl ester carboxylesterase
MSPFPTRFLFLMGYALVGGLLAGCVSSGPQMVDVGGRSLSMRIEGKGTPTIVFESGGGNDGSVWASIAADVRRRHDVRTVIYDRAGLGASDPAPLPYTIDDDAAALVTALDRAGVRGDVVLVAHSYGGYIATLVAASDPRIAGLVLVDAGIPGDLDEAGVERTLARYRPQYDTLRQVAPDLARRMIPMMEAYPTTIERVNGVTLSATLPVIDIVADEAWRASAADEERSRQAHAAFVAASPAREAVVATGSGHHVMRDRPDVVLEAIARMIERVTAGG